MAGGRGDRLEPDSSACRVGRSKPVLRSSMGSGMQSTMTRPTKTWREMLILRKIIVLDQIIKG